MNDKETKDKCAETLGSYLNEQGFDFDVYYVADEKNKLKEKLIDLINSKKFYKLSPNKK